MNMNRQYPKDNITEGAMRIVEEVATREQSRDRTFLLSKICEELEARYVGDSLEYHLSQMHIDSTSAILHAIDLFFTMEAMFPGTSFVKREKAAG